MSKSQSRYLAFLLLGICCAAVLWIADGRNGVLPEVTSDTSAQAPARAQNHLGADLETKEKMPIGVALPTPFSVQLANIRNDNSLNQSQKDEATNALLAKWIVLDPQAAWDWGLSTLGSPRSPNMAMINFNRERVRTMIDALIGEGMFDAAGKLIAEANPDYVSSASRPLVQAWVSKDMDAAIAWTASLTQPGAMRSNAITMAFRMVSKEDLEGANAMLPQFSGGNALESAATGVSLGFIDRKDRAGALQWLAGSVGENSDGAFDFAISNYFSAAGLAAPTITDFSKESELLTRIRNSDVFTYHSAQSWVANTQRGFPHEALQTIYRFYPASRKEAGLRKLFETWAATDPAVALDQIQKLNEPEELKLTLQRVVQAVQTR